MIKIIQGSKQIGHTSLGQNSKLLLYSQLFSFSKTKIKELLQQLNTFQNQHMLSTANSYQKLIELIQIDTNSKTQKFLHYSSINRFYKAYIDQIVNDRRYMKTKNNENNNGLNKEDKESFKQYDPNTIRLQGQRLSQLGFRLARYPFFKVQQKVVNDGYRIFCRLMNSRTDEQMNKMLLFSLRNDQKVQESVLYGQYLKFYLRISWETIKAKFQLDLRKQTVGQVIKKMFKGIIHRGFFRRSPSYDRWLTIQYPTQTLQLLLHNHSTKNSLFISKLMYEQIFTPIANYFQKNLHSNLYHPQNKILWRNINKNCFIIFNSNKLIQKQCAYLRQLYITLFLVLNQQQKYTDMQKYVAQIGIVYGFVKQNYESEKANQFLKVVQEFIQRLQNSQENNFKNIEINIHMFNLIQNFSSLRVILLNETANKLTPLLFNAYFNNFLNLLPLWTQNIISKIVSKQTQNYFNNIKISDSLKLINKMRAINLQQNSASTLKNAIFKVYHKIIQSIIHKDYSTYPNLNDAINMLQIYSAHKKTINNNADEQNHIENLSMLRVFLFRFIADNKHHFSRKQLEEVIQIVAELDDTQNFGDNQGNYQLNIFQQLQSVIDQFFINEDLKDKIRSKIPKRNLKSDKTSQIFDLLKKIQSKN